MNLRKAWSAAAALLVLLATVDIAGRQLGARSTEEWIKTLENPNRIKGLRVDDVLGKLGLKPGDVVADLGAGTGAFSLPLARAVGPKGKVYAVEIEPGLLDYLMKKAKAENIGNIQPVIGKPGDPALPASDVDLAFMHDVLHHIQDRRGYLEHAVRYLKPGGRFAFVEPEGETGPHSNDPTLQVTKQSLAQWMGALGFTRVQEFSDFPGKWYVVYARK